MAETMVKAHAIDRPISRFARPRRRRRSSAADSPHRFRPIAPPEPVGPVVERPQSGYLGPSGRGRLRKLSANPFGHRTSPGRGPLDARPAGGPLRPDGRNRGRHVFTNLLRAKPDSCTRGLLGERHWSTDGGHRFATMKPSRPGPKAIQGRRLPRRRHTAGANGTRVFSGFIAARGRDSVHGIRSFGGAADSSPLRDFSRTRFRTRIYSTHYLRPENWVIRSGFLPLPPSRLGNFPRDSQTGHD